MAEPVVTCPKCGWEIKLTESLAAPLVAATRRQFEEQLAAKDAVVAQREEALRAQEAAVTSARSSIEDTVRERLKFEREKIAQEEARHARDLLGGQLEASAKQIADLKEVLQDRDVKLGEAQQAEAELLRKQREVDDKARELELTVERRVQAGLEGVRDRARGEAAEEVRQKLAERDHIIEAMKGQLEEMKRRAEQGSQQLQGEVQELEFEALLSARFPRDTIVPVPKGEHGGDVVQHVIGPTGQHCGTILWESKRTKHWSDQWLPKLRDDQRAARAGIAALISTAIPKSVDDFDLIEGVWVAHPRVAIPLATALRQTLLSIALVNIANEGLQTKTELVYRYLIGSQFKHRIEAIIEAFTSMQADLQAEKRAIQRQWAKREKQIERVTESTTRMWGDLEGIVGKALPSLDGLELPASESDAVPVQPGPRDPVRSKQAIVAEVLALASEQGYITEAQIDRSMGTDWNEQASEVVEAIFVALADLNLPVYQDEREAPEKQGEVKAAADATDPVAALPPESAAGGSGAPARSE